MDGTFHQKLIKVVVYRATLSLKPLLKEKINHTSNVLGNTNKTRMPFLGRTLMK
jgi:hypothetical protein